MKYLEKVSENLKKKTVKMRHIEQECLSTLVKWQYSVENRFFHSFRSRCASTRMTVIWLIYIIRFQDYDYKQLARVAIFYFDIFRMIYPGVIMNFEDEP